MSLAASVPLPGPAAAEARLKLQLWLSPAFPVGAFAYSHGLEQAIEAGLVRDAAGLAAWLDDVLQRGGGWSDAVLLAAAWREASAGAVAALLDVADLAEALAPTRERHLETMAQGTAFLAAVEAGWPAPSLRALAAGRPRLAYPVAVGAAAAVHGAVHGLALEDTAAAFLNAFAATLSSVAVRLVPLGQSAGLGVLAGLQPLVLALAGRAASSTLDDLGGAAILSDIQSLRHETQYSRVFRT